MKPLLRLPIVCLLLLTACSTTRGDQAGATDIPEPQASTDARTWLRDFGSKYNYDVGYLEQLLDLSPAAYDAFAAGMGMAEHRVHLPLDAHYVALIGALLADDCGACTQLSLRMATEAGVDRAILRQVLEDPESLPPLLHLVYEYASQVVKGENAGGTRVTRLRQAYGDEGFAEMAVNVLGARIYPALRRALGAEKFCPPPNLDF